MKLIDEDDLTLTRMSDGTFYLENDKYDGIFLNISQLRKLQEFFSMANLQIVDDESNGNTNF